MPLNEREIDQDLANRQLADRVFDRHGSTRVFYEDWQDDYENLARVARNEFVMEWPDGRKENVDPAVPNMVDITSKDRAAVIAMSMPQVICQPEGPGDEARAKTDKLERIVGGLLSTNRIQSLSWDWSFDAMAGGLIVCSVIPDIAKPASERFPVFTRLDPQLCYPEPVFTRGPGVSSLMYSYEEYRNVVEATYKVELDWAPSQKPDTDKVQVIVRYDEVTVDVVVKSIGRQQGEATGLIKQWHHKLGVTPIAIGTSSNIHGTYSGEFAAGLGVLETWHRMQTMMMDDAARKVYPELIVEGIINPQDRGPDAVIEKENKDSTYEYVQHPNEPFTNMQMLNGLQASVRTSFLMPPSRSGDPNESIISAAGVNANQSQFNTAVQVTERLVLGPMLEQAIFIALKSEEVWSPDASKSVYGGRGHGYRETYTPSKDIAGYRNVRIGYGPMGGMDPINQSVLLLQFHGAGVMSTRRLLELNPMIEDPQREEKQMLKEKMEEVTIASLQQRVLQGTLDPYNLAMVSAATASDEVSLDEAIMALVPPAPPQATPPAAAPVGTAPGATTPGAPGIAGAAEGPNQSNEVTAALA